MCVEVYGVDFQGYFLTEFAFFFVPFSQTIITSTFLNKVLWQLLAPFRFAHMVTTSSFVMWYFIITWTMDDTYPKVAMVSLPIMQLQFDWHETTSNWNFVFLESFLSPKVTKSSMKSQERVIISLKPCKFSPIYGVKVYLLKHNFVNNSKYTISLAMVYVVINKDISLDIPHILYLSLKPLMGHLGLSSKDSSQFDWRTIILLFFS